MTSNLCRWGVDHSIVMQLVKMRGGTQYNIHLLCSLCRWRQTFADEGWNTVQLCNMCRWGVEQYNVHLLCNLCKWDQTGVYKGGTQHNIINYADEVDSTWRMKVELMLQYYITMEPKLYNPVSWDFAIVQNDGNFVHYTGYSYNCWVATNLVA